MTEFATEVRHYCRNPKCRSKLPKPVSNEREAFCARGCHTAFYRTRCRICEGPIKQPKRGERLICRKAACIKAFREHGSQAAELISKTPDFIGPKVPVRDDRGL